MMGAFTRLTDAIMRDHIKRMMKNRQVIDDMEARPKPKSKPKATTNIYINHTENTVNVFMDKEASESCRKRIGW